MTRAGSYVRVPTRRADPRPQTQRTLPHRQLDQWPPEAIIQELQRQSLRLPNVRGRQSRMAFPETCALYLPDGIAHGPAEAFIDDHEFCHLHPLPAGSLHLTLADPLRTEAVRQGWAELHPCGEAGFLPDTLVMVYAPRNEHELAVVLGLVNTSYRFAMGHAREDS